MSAAADGDPTTATPGEVRALPLDGVVVLDVGTRISAPFCAGVLGEQGAEVIKVEQPGQGDFMRTIGPFEDGYSLWWSVEGRGRRSVTCDLRSSQGQELFRRLAEHADVVVENFRPGTVERWGIGPDDLDPHLVYVRISAFGQEGPYAKRPGLDRIGTAVGGLLHLTGEPDRPPVRVGVNISDYLTGIFAAQAATAALYARDTGDGRGRVVDAALHASALRVLEWTLAGADRLGIDREREGNRMSNAAPGDCYPTGDGRYAAIVAGSGPNFRRLCEAMGRTDLLDDPRFATTPSRAEHGAELNDLVAAWTSERSAMEVETACAQAGVPCAVARSASDILVDPHIEARGDLVTVDDPVVGPVRQQAPFPRYTDRPPTVPTGAPRLGEHNEQVWCDLVGLSQPELLEHRERGTI